MRMMIILIVGGFGLISLPVEGDKERQRSRELTITLTGKGYQPEKLRVKRGVPLKLTFVRQVEATCATEVELVGYGIRRELPVNQPVVIDFTPDRTGEIVYTCAMKMVGGKIFVK